MSIVRVGPDGQQFFFCVCQSLSHLCVSFDFVILSVCHFVHYSVLCSLLFDATIMNASQIKYMFKSTWGWVLQNINLNQKYLELSMHFWNERKMRECEIAFYRDLWNAISKCMHGFGGSANALLLSSIKILPDL